MLSKITDYPEINLATRVVQIMDELVGQHNYSAEYEEKLRNELSYQGLKIPFRRPRVLAARQSIYHLISELVDSRCMSFENAILISNTLAYIDPKLAKLNIVRKPSFIKIDLPDSPTDDWLEERITSDQLLVGKSFNNGVIVGELKIY